MGTKEKEYIRVETVYARLVDTHVCLVVCLLLGACVFASGFGVWEALSAL